MILSVVVVVGGLVGFGVSSSLSVVVVGLVATMGLLVGYHGLTVVVGGAVIKENQLN